MAPPGIASVRVDAEGLFQRQRRVRLERARIGRRARSLVSERRGKYGRHRLARPADGDIAFDATLRAAAVRLGRAPLEVEPADLRRKLRRHRSLFAICFVVDNSWSVHAERMVEKVKGVVLRLLEDTTAQGDRVALVAFRGGVPEGTVVLPLTASIALARRRLRAIPLSGRTPLADALRRARILLRQERFKHVNGIPLVVVVTDGRPTVPLRAGGDPLRDVLTEAQALRRAGVICIVADAAPPGSGSCAAEIARLGGGFALPIAELAPDVLVDVLEKIA